MSTYSIVVDLGSSQSLPRVVLLLAPDRTMVDRSRIETGPELQRAIVALCKAGRSLDKVEMQQCEQFVEVLQDRLKHKAYDFIRQHHDDPIFMAYSSDGTPELVSHRVQTPTVGKGLGAIQRSGRHVLELLMQRVHFKAPKRPGRG